jgi:hypothetical protein
MPNRFRQARPARAAAITLRRSRKPHAAQVDTVAPSWDQPTAKLIADAKGRLTAAELFKPGRSFDASLMPDGSIRIIEPTEKQVPVAKVTFRKDGTFSLSQRPGKASIMAALRADRDAR